MSAHMKLLTEHARLVTNSTIANWNSGVAPSGQPGAELVTIGQPLNWIRLSLGAILTTGFNAAATVTVREYSTILGAMRLIFEDDWTMPQEMVMVSWLWFDVELYGQYRIELYSDQGADDGLAVSYEYWWKDW